MIITIKGFCPLDSLDKLLNKLSYEHSVFFKNLISFKYNYYNDLEIFNFLNFKKDNTLDLFINKIEENNPNEINIIHTFNAEMINLFKNESIFSYDDNLFKLINNQS